jgi:FtsP/CotA-like multicopper oxidase with cupredoxin domain
MDQPGVSIFGVTHDDDHKAGMGTVVEYANQHGLPKWMTPPRFRWDYTLFGRKEDVPKPDAHFELVFRKVPGGKGGYNRWTINGKSYPDTNPMLVDSGRRYRLIFSNQSDDAHPVHLHRQLRADERRGQEDGGHYERHCGGAPQWSHRGGSGC